MKCGDLVLSIHMVSELIIKSLSSSFLIHRRSRFTLAMATCFDERGLNTAYSSNPDVICITHTHTHPFNGLFSRTTQKGKTDLDITEARDSEWQWHLLGHTQVCTSLQTENHAITPSLSFLQTGCPSCHPTNSIKGLKASEPPHGHRPSLYACTYKCTYVRTHRQMYKSKTIPPATSAGRLEA